MRFLYIFFALLIASHAYAADYYADYPGSGSSGCTTGDPCTIYRCLETVATTGDTCLLKDNTYPVDIVTVPAGINLKSESEDASLVILTAGVSDGNNPMIQLVSDTPGTNGNQTISHITIDGESASYDFDHGILVKNRDNVTIHDCVIKDFQGAYGSVSETGVSGGSYGVYVYSSNFPQTQSTYAYVSDDGLWSQDNWPTDPVDNFQFYDNDVDTCGEGVQNPSTQGRVFSPAIYPLGLKNSSFHGNDINVSHATTQAFYSTPAFLEDVDIYNNILTGHSTGKIQNTGSKSLYLAELWLMWDFKFYNNHLINGGASLAVGKNLSYYNNKIDRSAATDPTGYGIEATASSYTYVYNNYLIGNPTAGGHFGIALGNTDRMNKKPWVSYQWAFGNIVEDIRWDGFRLHGDTPASAPTSTAYLYVYNNIVDNCDTTGGGYGAILAEQGEDGVLHITAKNNIITNSGTGFRLYSGSLASKDIDYNLLNGNTTNYVGTWDSTNVVTTAPTYTTGYEPASGGSQTNAGVSLADTFANVLRTTTDWTTSPPTVATADQAANGSGWEIGAYVYTDAANTVPVITASDPTQGEVLTAGTTSKEILINATDDSIVSGCKADTRASVAYGSKAITLANNGDGTWDHTVSGLTNNTTYDYYYECVDDDTEYSDEYHLMFGVANSASEIVIDNTEAAVDSAWTPSTYWQNCGGGSDPCYYGANYMTDGTTGADSPSRYARFIPDIQVAGTYNVYEWHTADGTRPTEAVHDVTHAGGTTEVLIDQTQNGAQWNLVGTYTFDTGTTGRVVITAENTGNTCADAIKFELASEGGGGASGGGSGYTKGGGTGFILGK
jgi:hypothetical protein